MSIDENIMNFLYEQSKSPILPYQPGDIIPVRITKIVDYGAFVVTKDQYLASGLIHISQIPEGLKLRTMQIIDAKVRQVKNDNKVELSLLHHENSPLEAPRSKEAPIDEVQEIIQYLSKEFGLVSEEAKQKVEMMVKEMGVFRFTMAMMKALPTFKRDLVYHFLKELNQERGIVDPARFRFTRHLRERLEERLGKRWSNHSILQLIQESQVLLQTEDHLYLYHPGEDIRFPCIRDGEEWVIKSAIVQGMWMEAKE